MAKEFGNCTITGLHHNPAVVAGLKSRFKRPAEIDTGIIDDGRVTMQPFMLSSSIHTDVSSCRDIVVYMCRRIKYLILEIGDGGYRI